MHITNKVKALFAFWLMSFNVFGETDFIVPAKVDFIHYKAELAANVKAKSITGKVDIKFMIKVEGTSELSFFAKNKTIYSVTSSQVKVAHHIRGEQLIVSFTEPLIINKPYIINVEYQALPERGLKLHEDHLFTVYHTKNWLVSHGDIADKASFELFLTHHSELTSVGNGQLLSKRIIGNNNAISHWLQASPMPVYTFGFALGKFEQIQSMHNGSQLSYLYREHSTSGLSQENIKQAFNDVPDMIDFFERKAGFSLPNKSYKYVVVKGYMAQEATGFSLVGEKYVHTVLEDVNENWFIAHELAHEWWGNNITCANFSHFWLNEGLVQFLVAAYKEHLFGEAAYKREISIAISRVNKAVERENISPVAFKQPIKEKEINRTMVYSKGALVFYMLRKKLGDETFWQALKYYSKENQQSSVTTSDLKKAFEQVSEQDLTPFFNRWVYGNEIPALKL